MRVTEYKATRQIPIVDIKPYEKNTKIHDAQQVQEIAESIKRFGFVQPVVVDGENVIIIGHARYEAAKLLQLETVPCIRKEDLTKEEAAALRILDNKLNESPWDVDILPAELEAIQADSVGVDSYDQEPQEAPPIEEDEPFVVPPASALRGDSRSWLRRKRQWVNLGITSEKGRL